MHTHAITVPTTTYESSSTIPAVPEDGSNIAGGARTVDGHGQC